MNQQQISVGDIVTLITQPAYLKTADPMPMLRPPDVLAIGEQGVVTDRRPGDYWVVRFPRGSFLIESRYLQLILKHSLTEQQEL